jgi:hypothetical protein
MVMVMLPFTVPAMDGERAPLRFGFNLKQGEPGVPFNHLKPYHRCRHQLWSGLRDDQSGCAMETVGHTVVKIL